MSSLQMRFEDIYNLEYEREYFSPGRINLIGEHIDYSGGLVLPCAITLGTSVLLSEREDSKLVFYSDNMQDVGVIEIDLNDLEYNKNHSWTNYPKGVFALLKEQGHKFDKGLNLLYNGTIPYASGLSSSASILMATAVIANDVYELNIDRLDLVKLTKDVENNYIGVNTGIMDQFSIGFGKEEAAILLNTDTLDYEYIPLDLKDNSIVIMNTNKKRGLADSAYNDRRQTCDQAFDILKEEYDIEYLCDLSLDQLEAKKDLLSEGKLYDRAYHAVSENERTKLAAEVLKAGNIEEFGMLMNESHYSLRDKYEVTGLELDTLQTAALSIDGCLGARVTGAGFGGCAIAIVNNAKIDEFIEAVGTDYLDKIGYAADFYVASVGPGTARVK